MVVSEESSSSSATPGLITSMRNVCGNKEKVGRWSQEEHEVFVKGLETVGKQWKVIAGLIGTRTVVQVRTHAQKYFQKVERSGGAGVSMSFSARAASEIPNKKPGSQQRKSTPKKKQQPSSKRKSIGGPRKIRISMNKSQSKRAEAPFVPTGTGVPNPFLDQL